uniref:glucuronosyltransferase n=1 Tax=Panagrellus redivivus TaxID=6233 RepID=A0A7E4W8H5_PANRE
MTVASRILLCLALLFAVANAGKVLIYNPHVSHSHFVFQNELADILVDAGHNVTMLIPELDPEEIKVKTKANVIIRSPPKNHYNIEMNNQGMFWSGASISMFSMYSLVEKFKENQNGQCDRLFADEKFAQFMREQKFDIGMLEPIDPCGTMYFKYINVTNFVTSSPMALYDNYGTIFGLPGRSQCTIVCTDWLPTMGLVERAKNFFVAYVSAMVFKHSTHYEAISAKYNLDYDYNDGIAGARYFFLNTEEHMDFPRPISHKTIYIGGITIKPNTGNGLPEDLEKRFESAEKVVLVSFGSIAKSSVMPDAFKKAFISMFEAYPETTFIWKYENVSSDPAAHLPNVIISPWIPQKAILAHPKTIAFITHGGMNSITEVAHAGIPIVAIPLFSDQYRNAKMLEYRKTAVIVEKAEITPESLIEAMKTVTSDEYRKRAADLASVIGSKPISPKQRFLMYFEHALAHGGAPDFLDMETRHFSTIRYYDLDLVAGALLILLIVLYVFYRFGKFLVSIVKRNNVKVKKN